MCSSDLCEILEDFGIKSAKIYLGGNTQLKGLKPDGSRWRVGITDPYDSSSLLGIITVENKAVITSGGYERFFLEPACNHFQLAARFAKRIHTGECV